MIDRQLHGGHAIEGEVEIERRGRIHYSRLHKDFN